MTDNLCIPPPEHRRHLWHWLRHNEGHPQPVRWVDQKGDQSGICWITFETGSMCCDWAYTMGWRYVGPAPLPGEQDDTQQVAWLETKLAEADVALAEIRTITGLTHTGTPRAHAALSQIDQIARKALA